MPVKPTLAPVKSWEVQLAEGRQAFYDDPGQSLRGKNDVFRQGFYAAQETGYTHIISYQTTSKVFGPVTAKFRTTADAVKHHRRSLLRKGIKHVNVEKI